MNLKPHNSTQFKTLFSIMISTDYVKYRMERIWQGPNFNNEKININIDNANIPNILVHECSVTSFKIYFILCLRLKLIASMKLMHCDRAKSIGIAIYRIAKKRSLPFLIFLIGWVVKEIKQIFEFSGPIGAGVDQVVLSFS